MLCAFLKHCSMHLTSALPRCPPSPPHCLIASLLHFLTVRLPQCPTALLYCIIASLPQCPTASLTHCQLLVSLSYHLLPHFCTALLLCCLVAPLPHYSASYCPTTACLIELLLLCITTQHFLKLTVSLAACYYAFGLMPHC